MLSVKLCYNGCMRFAVGSLLALLILLTPFVETAAQAQGAAGAYLSSLNSGRFPRIQAFLEVHDAQGRFVHGLTPDQVVILEDGNPRPLLMLEELKSGCQVVVAINPGSSFAIRNNKAISRYDLIKEVLQAWAIRRRGSSLDDLSLIITNGASVGHTVDPQRWLDVLESEKGDFRNARPSLDTLARAISLASDATARPGMSRVVIFITALPEGEYEAALQNLAAQARLQSVTIHTWLVASRGALVTAAAQALRALSEGSGGQMFTFSGEEPLPDLEQILDPLRYTYLLEYESAAANSGSHQVEAQVQLEEASIKTPPQAFEINVQPPQPAFVSPPTQIEIEETTPAQEERALYNQPQGGPASPQQVLQVVFDFPDGHPRQVVYAALLVNGAVVAENTQPPFERFAWDPRPYAGQGVVRLQVQARDQLGLSGSSLEIEVPLKVRQNVNPQTNPLRHYMPMLSLLLLVIAASFLLLVLVLGGYLRPRPWRAAQRWGKSDPVTQPLRIVTEPPSRPLSASRVVRAAPPTSQAEAYLNPLPRSKSEETMPPIAITEEELTLGSDPSLATLVIDDPSVEALHARLVKTPQGGYRLADQGTVAGTWINYTPVSPEGALLEHGDLVHIGRVGFRFTRRSPSPSRRPRVIVPPPGGLSGGEEAL